MTKPKTGHFILHSNVIPTLTAGSYELVTEHSNAGVNVAPEHTHIHVASPRYSMPTDQILSTFPPANAEGNFGERLPQIVLKRRTLPWERNPAGEAKPSATPWLALVVVAEGEAQLSTATPVDKCVTPGTKLLDPDDKDVEQGLYLTVTETVVRKIFPCKQDLELLVHVREVDINDTELANGDDDGWLAVVLANRLPVFDSANDKPVRYMACLVNVEGQLDALPPLDSPQNDFIFEKVQDWSVLASIDMKAGADAHVMGGVDISGITLPKPGKGPAAAMRLGKAENVAAAPKASAALDGSAAMKAKPVSGQWANATKKVAAAALDPDAKRLVRDTMGAGFRFPIEVFALEKKLRFPVLAHWSFTTAGDANFETLMQDLDVSLLGTVEKADETTRKAKLAAQAANAAQQQAEAPPPAPKPEVVETGHIGLSHRTRRGDATEAWYRGPCVPFPTPRDASRPDGSFPLAHAADQLRKIVPDGREDLSLAAAFEIGRLLALSQLSVVSALLRFRSEQFGIGRVREILASLSPFEIPNLLDQRIDLGRFVAIQMMDGLATNHEHMIGTSRPVADPGRKLSFKGDLDAVVAAGLGMNLDALRETGEQIGMLAAVAQAQVPIANQKGTIELDKQAVSGLRSALFEELGHALNVAAPPVLRSGTKRSRAAPPPDALDELIERAQAQSDEEDLS